MFKHILAALDTSENSAKALDYAAHLASQDKATLHIISVIEALTTAYPVGVSYAYNEVHLKVMREQYEKLQAEKTAKLKETYPLLTVTAEIAAGRPATVITEAAKTADLIVIGHRGQSRIVSWILGSVAREIVDNCTASVLVIKEQC